MRWFRKVVNVIICVKIRADEGDLVSEELRKRAAQCIQRSVIRQWFGCQYFDIICEQNKLKC